VSELISNRTPPPHNQPLHHQYVATIPSYMYPPSARIKNRLSAHNGTDNITMTTIPPLVVAPLFVEVITVPAVPGRLLLFQGDYLHVAPQPTDVWFLSLVQSVPKYNPEVE